jgi:hypothetical protein
MVRVAWQLWCHGTNNFSIRSNCRAETVGDAARHISAMPEADPSPLWEGLSHLMELKQAPCGVSYFAVTKLDPSPLRQGDRVCREAAPVARMSHRSRECAAGGDIRGRSRISLRSCGLRAAGIKCLRTSYGSPPEKLSYPRYDITIWPVVGLPYATATRPVPGKLPGRKPLVTLRDVTGIHATTAASRARLTHACATGQGQGAAKALAGCRLDACCTGRGQGQPRGGVARGIADMAGPAVGSTRS